MIVRVGEDNRPADGKIVDRRDPLHRRLAPALSIPVLNAYRHLPQRERGADQDEELHEVPALDVEILRPIDREILPPGWLSVGGREVRRDRDLLALEPGCIEVGGGRTGETFTPRRVDRRIDWATGIGANVGHRYTSTSANGSLSTGAAPGALTIFSDTARFRGRSSMAAVTSTCGAALVSLRGTIT